MTDNKVKYTLPDKDIISIADHVCLKMKGTPEQMEEYFAQALLGVAIALSTYDPTKGTKLFTYCYSKAYWSVKAYQAQQRTKSRGFGCITLSIDELAEKGYQIADDCSLICEEEDITNYGNGPTIKKTTI